LGKCDQASRQEDGVDQVASQRGRQAADRRDEHWIEPHVRNQDMLEAQGDCLWQSGPVLEP
jgi:hypothetical protein